MKTCPTCQETYPNDFSVCPQDGARLIPHASQPWAELAAGLARRFRIVRQLGAGGMGAVFLAEQIAVGNRRVALKVLLHQLLDDPDFLLRFQNEAASAGRIHHSNVVTIYESGQGDDGTPYIAMEFLEGESLRDALRKRGALPVAECAEILRQAARGLNAAHKLGIIHRDLKPDNIFLTRDEEGELIVKVVDFGIAKLRESATHTIPGMVLGTPAYMSYEQAMAMRSDELDARSDIYSLGVVVYEMLSGRVPFESDTPFGYLQKHTLEQPPPFHAAVQGLGVPPAVERAVMRALAKNRDLRYSSALEFARELCSAAGLSPPIATPMPLPGNLLAPLPEDAAARGPEPFGGVPSTTQPKAAAAEQPLSFAPPGQTGDSSGPFQQGNRGGTEAATPDVSSTLQFPAATKRSAWVITTVLASGLLIVITIGIWHFSHTGQESSPRAAHLIANVSPPSGATAEMPRAEPRTRPSLATPLETPQVANVGNGLTAEPEASVRNAVAAWVQAFRSKDTTALANSYAPMVEKYFLRTNLSREQISQILASTFAGLAEIRGYEVTDIRIASAPSNIPLEGINHSRVTATFHKAWDTLQSDGKVFSGEEIEQLTFASTPQGWKIIREEELKILRVSRH